MDLETILILVSAVLGIISLVAGGFWVKAKGKLDEVAILFKETSDLVGVANNALEDNKITPEEVAQIKKEWLELKQAWKDLIG